MEEYLKDESVDRTQQMIGQNLPVASIGKGELTTLRRASDGDFDVGLFQRGARPERGVPS